MDGDLIRTGRTARKSGSGKGADGGQNRQNRNFVEGKRGKIGVFLQLYSTFSLRYVRKFDILSMREPKFRRIS